jgi:hypothetical protein
MVMRNQSFRARRSIAFSAWLIFLAAGPLLSAVKQVRVTVERASIYIEPSRTSARIEIVGKGTILNLLQERKVKDIWYYVSFNSPRYGTRISGFIQESAVELAGGSPPAPPKKEEKVPLKVEPGQVRPPEVVPPPKIEEKKEVAIETPAVPSIVEAVALTKLPKSRSYKFPRKEGLLLEEGWKVIAGAPDKEERPSLQVSEFVLLTAPSKHRMVSLPKKEKPREDPAWQVIRPVIAEIPKPTPPEVKKEAAETKPETKPAELEPIRMSQIKPPRKGPGFLTLGLGYGSSFGGAGGCLQLNTRMGLSLHAGVGVYPATLVFSETDWVKNETLWSIGLKYYLPLRPPSFSPFIDIQYGGLRVEAAQVVIGIWDYNYIFRKVQKSLWGPSCLAGFEFRIGRFGISAALGASYATTSWEYLENKVSFVFDTGLVFHF